MFQISRWLPPSLECEKAVSGGSRSARSGSSPRLCQAGIQASSCDFRPDRPGGGPAVRRHGQRPVRGLRPRPAKRPPRGPARRRTRPRWAAFGLKKRRADDQRRQRMPLVMQRKRPALHLKRQAAVGVGAAQHGAQAVFGPVQHRGIAVVRPIRRTASAAQARRLLRAARGGVSGSSKKAIVCAARAASQASISASRAGSGVASGRASAKAKAAPPTRAGWTGGHSP